MKAKSLFTAAAGVLLLAVGVTMARGLLGDGLAGVPGLPYVAIGVGAMLFGDGMGRLVGDMLWDRDPQARRRFDIEAKDERNVTLTQASKAMAYDCMVFVFGALLLTYALMGVDLSLVLLLVAAYLFVIGYGIYHRARLSRRI